MKKTHCLRGHLRSPNNLTKVGNCRICDAFRRSPAHTPKLKTSHCKNGHPRTPETVFPTGACKICTAAAQKRWSENNKSYWRKNWVKRYGITEEQYQEMYSKQQGLCGCCGTWKKVLCVDHCHNTQIIRGLLCSACNRAIGQLGDSLDGLLKAVAYLQRSENLLAKVA